MKSQIYERLMVSTLAVIVFVISYITISDYRKDNHYAREELKWYRDIIKCKQGGTTLYNPSYQSQYLKDIKFKRGDILNYKFCSFDSGETWYAIDIYQDKEYDGFKLIGPLECIFPGLKRQLQEVHRLYKNND